MRGESAFSVRADDWRRPRYGPPDGAIDYLALFLNTFSAPKQPRQLGGSKRLSAGSATEQPRDRECARPHRAAHVAHLSRRVDRIGHDFRSWHFSDVTRRFLCVIESISRLAPSGTLCPPKIRTGLFISRCLVDAAIMSSRGHPRAPKIWIDHALCRAARC